MSGFTPAFHVIADPYMPTRMRVRYPKKGPYYRRRVKRTANDPRSWQWPEKPFTIFGLFGSQCGK